MREPICLYLDPSGWKKARKSNAEGNCVELNRTDPRGTAVADTKVGRYMRVNVRHEAAAAFLDGVKAGAFDGNLAA